MATTESLTVYPETYDTSISTLCSVTNASNVVGKGSSNTSPATIQGSGNYSSPTTYWPFDVSAIPENATIDSVSCKAKIASASSSGWYGGSLSLCADTTEKASYTLSGFISSAITIYTISGGEWTRDEISNVKLKIYSKWYSGSKPKFYFYGADLTVEYTYQSEKYMLKVGGTWADVARVFKKVDGVWVEQESLEGVVDAEKTLVNGGEYDINALLPAGYTRLETFDADGSQVFDTGIAASADLEIEIGVTPNSAGLSEHAIFGSEWSLNGFFLMFYNSAIRFHSKGVSVDVTNFDTSGMNVIKCTQTSLTVNGATYDLAGTGTDSTDNIILFGVSDTADVTTGNNGILSCHFVKFKLNGVMDMYWIPCTNADGVAGFYDVVDKVFHTPGGG